MDYQLDTSVYGQCTKEYLPSPSDSWLIWLADGQMAIFSCLPGYGYQSQDQYSVLLCDQDTLEWQTSDKTCRVLDSNGDIPEGKHTTISQSWPSRQTSDEETIKPSKTSTEYSRQPDEDGHLTKTPTHISTEPTTVTEANKGTPQKNGKNHAPTSPDIPLGEASAISRNWETSSKTARDFVTSSQTAVELASRKPPSTSASLKPANDQSLTDEKTSPANRGFQTDLFKEDPSRSDHIDYDTTRLTSEPRTYLPGSDVTSKIKDNDGGLMAIVFGVFLSVAVIIILTIVFVVVLRKKEKGRQERHEKILQLRESTVVCALKSSNCGRNAADEVMLDISSEGSLCNGDEDVSTTNQHDPSANRGTVEVVLTAEEQLAHLDAVTHRESRPQPVWDLTHPVRRSEGWLTESTEL